MIVELIHKCTLVAQVSLILSILIYVFRFKFLPTELKRLGPYMVITLFIQYYAAYLSRQGLPNLYLLHLYTLLEFLAWAFFYHYLFRNRPRLIKVYPWIVGIISVLIVANTIFLEPVSGFNSNAKSLVQLTLISSAIYYFFIAFGKIDLALPLPRSLTQINFGIIIYYSATLFIFMFSRFLNDNDVAPVRHNFFWAINGLFHVIFQMLLLLSLWTIAFRRTKSS